MPTVPISMRKLKEILRLKYGVGLSHRQIGRSLAISPSVVSRYANRAAQLGIKQWPLPTGWDDTKLKHAFLQTRVKMKKHSLPDWATVHRELRNKCVTLQLLWEEYCERNPGGFTAITITAGCTVNGSKPLHHQCVRYIKLAKNFSLITVDLPLALPTLDRRNKNCSGHRSCSRGIKLHMGRGHRCQQLEDWVMSHVRCFQWLGGVPELVVRTI